MEIAAKATTSRRAQTQTRAASSIQITIVQRIVVHAILPTFLRVQHPAQHVKLASLSRLREVSCAQAVVLGSRRSAVCGLRTYIMT